MSKKFKHAVFIGRFQPFHQGHLDAIRFGRKIADELTVVIGSAYQSRSIRNPFDAGERCMLMSNEGIDRIVYKEDDPYNDDRWRLSLLKLVDRWQDTAIIGLDKDKETAFYLKMFPEWTLRICPDGGHRGIEATQIRDDLFRGLWFKRSKDALIRRHGDVYMKRVFNQTVPSSHEYLQQFIDEDRLKNVIDDWLFINEYRKSWSHSPFPPVFVTTDAVVTWRDQLLMIRRGGMPGKGKLALPGGFLEPRELLLTCALRELREETGVVPTVPPLAHEAFDHPFRSARGRNITHGFYWDLPRDMVVEAKAGDDAGLIDWVRFDRLHQYRDQMMSDHYHIARHFIGEKIPYANP